MLSFMFRKIAAFEFRYQLTSPVFLVVAVLFFLLAFGNVVSDNVQIAAVGNVNVNSPDAITQVHQVMSIIALFVVTAFLAGIVLRDFEFRSAEMLFTTQVRKRPYLLGRFVGAYAVVLVAFSFVTLGMILGTLMPGVDQDRLGVFNGFHYAYVFAVVVAPNLLFAGAFAFALATLTRNLLITYVGVVGFMLLYGITQNILDQPDLRQLANLLDPFGIAAYTDTVRYWTAFERNAQVVPLRGDFLWNRLVWLGVSLLLIALTYWRFKFQLSRRRRTVRQPAETLNNRRGHPRAAYATATAGLQVQPAPALRPWRQFWGQVGFEVTAVLKSIPFVILVALAIITTYFSFVNLNQLFGTPVYPLTRVLTNVMQGTFTLSLLIVVIYYGAELVWRERQYRCHELLDATPAPSWVFTGAKTLALLLVIVILLSIGVATSVLYQLAQGYTRFEWSVYLTRHLLDYGRLFYFAAILSIFIQILVRNKFTGMALMVAYVVIVLFALDSLGFEDPLYQFGTRADVAYSDMNGWGHYAWIALWYALYWGSVCALMYVATYLLWRRGAVEALWLRLRHVPELFARPAQIASSIAFLVFLCSGMFIFYNTHILNPYVTQNDIEQSQITYEQRFQSYEATPQPRIVGIKAEVAVYPDELRYTVYGNYTLENRTGAALEQVMVGFSPIAQVQRVALENAVLSDNDPAFNYYVFDLMQPLPPGEHVRLSFVSGRHQQGFKHARNSGNALGQSALSYNGSFIFNNEAFPYLGYDRNLVLTDRNARRRHGLAPIDRFPDLEDQGQYGNSYLRQDSDWINFDVTVSTKLGQTAIAPGYLQRQWEQDGRQYFHYQMDAPMQNLFAFLSAEYERAHEQWNGIDLEVFYHRHHAFNVDKMLASVKRSLNYFTEHFSPYQYRQMRILEFPAFAGNFAVSFPNTVPWSEGLGFIANVESPDDIDYVLYVGAHEVAHQWWGHQVSSANVQGQTLLLETLAQYSALMVMEQEYGPHLMRRFLKYELDNYLSNRGNEAEAELPLYRVENQDYVHYSKGSLVMYALKDYLGEERINQALRQFIGKYAYAHDPYPTALDLLAEFKAQARDDQEQALITDLFERITLWDLRVLSSRIQERDDGLFNVEITINAAKFESDGLGQEQTRPLYMPIDVGIFTASPGDHAFNSDNVLYLNKEWVQDGQATFHFTVEERPTHVGIDPYNKLIDRNAADNVSAVVVE